MNDALLVEHDPALPLVQFSIGLRNGSATDPVGQEGLTRLTLRLMRRTARGLPADVIDEQVDSLGAALGSDVSVSTAGFSCSTISRSLPDFVQLVNGVLAQPGFDEAELARLKRETLAELIEQRDNDQALVQRWFRRTLFANHPYGRSSTGSPQSLERITVADVRAHWQRHFVRSNLVWAFSGDVTAELAERLVAAMSEGLPNTALAHDELATPTPLPGRRLVFVDKPERTQTQILMGGLGSWPHDPDHVALLVANTAFGGTFTARLMQQIRAERGWSYGAYSQLPYERKRQAFSMWCFPAATDAAQCLELELQMLEDFVANGITAEELAYAKQYLVNSNVFNMDTAAKRLGQRFDEVIYQLPAGYHRDYATRVAAVTLEDVNAAVRRRISAQDLLIVVVATASDSLESIRSSIPNLTATTTIPYDQD